ncbi:Cdc6/Cdc18 family protein [Haloarcula marina]|uniref:Cdc6/Cdc18 family protein n=1 Tax=Haloarcula marina TaxID=2961574 RepID=UPI0020B73EC3|nr:AAA family ATPase [Halomicroarcula marina]
MEHRDNDDEDNIFSTGSIFANRELVRIGHVPELSRIVGRDNEVRALGQALGPATIGGPPETTTIYGKTGTGKSLVARCVTREAKLEAERNDVAFQFAYVDCSDYRTDAQASREMAHSLASNLNINGDVPQSGLAAADYRDITWKTLKYNNVNSFVVILDEIDTLDDDELLRSLSRAKESGKASAYIGVICISNKVEFRDRLNERLNSSLQDKELIFDPYDAGQLREILNSRADAFEEDVLEEEVIPKVAALAARAHGDARKAIDTLYEAGRLAETAREQTVTSTHVDEAVERAAINRFQSLIEGTTPHVKYILHALAVLTVETPKTDVFRTHRIYNVYSNFADEDGAEPLSEERVYRLLKEQSFLGITESNHTGGGRGEGSYLEHRLLQDPEIVLQALGRAKTD